MLQTAETSAKGAGTLNIPIALRQESNPANELGTLRIKAPMFLQEIAFRLDRRPVKLERFRLRSFDLEF